MDERSAKYQISTTKLAKGFWKRESLIIISESEYSQPMVARIKSAGWRKQEAKMDETGNVKYFCSDHLRYRIQDLNQKGLTITIFILYT